MSQAETERPVADRKNDTARNAVLIVSIALNILLGAWWLNGFLSEPSVNLSDNSMNKMAAAVSPAYADQVRAALAKPAATQLDAELAHRQASQHFIALLSKEDVTRAELVEAMGAARNARNAKTAAYHAAFAELLAALPLEERIKIRNAIVGPAGAE
ncbi:MAG: periplasmic heavy metal sensor [Alphaproteobacteria bacterium]